MSIMNNNGSSGGGPLGVNKSHYLSQGDLKTRCPSCSGNSTENIGVLTINGSPRDVHKCTSCNKIYSREDGGIASLVDEAKEVFKTENVGFTANSHTVVNSTSNNSNANLNLDWEAKQGINDIKNSLSQIQSNTSGMYNLSSILSAIQTLSTKIEQLSRQNVDLMEKLATDPLVNIRKRVSDFNLE